MPLHLSRFLLGDIFADVATSFSPRAAEQNVQLQASSPPDLFITAD
ncbi:MAG: hypothetical protein NT121_01175 [Chloroflexi bacterium]|nr:hypothetical protein [Chloroflexota bacterium]